MSSLILVLELQSVGYCGNSVVGVKAGGNVTIKQTVNNGASKKHLKQLDKSLKAIQQNTDPHTLALEIAHELPGYQEMQEKEKYIKELEAQIAELQKDKNPLRQEALRALTEKNYNEYIRLLDKASDEEITASKKKAAQDQLNIGAIAQFINPDRAEKAFSKALEYLPDWSTHLSAANFHQFLNHFQQAEELYCKALSLASSNDERATTLNNLANLQKAKNDYAGAEQGTVKRWASIET